jgi:hypothetical protein
MRIGIGIAIGMEDRSKGHGSIAIAIPMPKDPAEEGFFKRLKRLRRIESLFSATDGRGAWQR